MKDMSSILLKLKPNWIIFLIACGMIVYMVFQYMKLNQRPPYVTMGQVWTTEWPESGDHDASIWTIIKKAGSSATDLTGPMAQRFRLAGTFFTFQEHPDGEHMSRKAILDDLQEKTQHLVKEGERIAGATISRIFRDRVVVLTSSGEEELWLSFAGGMMNEKPTEPSPASKNALRMEDMPALETSRFGKRVGESRWVMQREEIETYYQELLDDPERMASLFLTMKPDYQNNKIEGYVVDIEGEPDFFKAAGLQQGDIVRKVNSMKMTSQRRAEYFIGEFIKNRMNAIVLEVDRGEDQNKKLIYLIR